MSFTFFVATVRIFIDDFKSSPLCQFYRRFVLFTIMVIPTICFAFCSQMKNIEIGMFNRVIYEQKAEAKKVESLAIRLQSPDLHYDFLSTHLPVWALRE